MRAAWLLVVLAACDGRDPPIVMKDLDQLRDADRHVLIKTHGRISDIRVHGQFSPAHLSFALEHGGKSVVVVTKDVVPDILRDGADGTVTGRYVRAGEVREALDNEGFRDVTGDVLLARDVFVKIDFQF